MRPIEAMLRDSGQYGPAVPVADDAPAVERLMGFVGRDPAWRPVTAAPDERGGDQVVVQGDHVLHLRFRVRR